MRQQSDTAYNTRAVTMLDSRVEQVNKDLDDIKGLIYAYKASGDVKYLHYIQTKVDLMAHTQLSVVNLVNQSILEHSDEDLSGQI
jgi:hypothetical protein